MLSILFSLIFLIPLCLKDFGGLLSYLFFVTFVLLFRFPYFICSSNLSCDYISFCLILLSFLICVFMILASEFFVLVIFYVLSCLLFFIGYIVLFF